MDTRLTLILACIATSITMSAKQVTGDEALARFKAESNTTQLAVRAAKGKQFVAAKTIYTVDKTEALYLYRSGNTMLVFPADDRVTPLLGYYDASSAVSDQMPSQLQWWLSEYARQIAYIQTLPEGKYEYKAETRTDDFEPIAPLLTTKWDQGSPYNLKCPTYNGDLCYTGCVATAGAQVMNYFKYPQKATGSIKYTDLYSGVERSMNFDEESFDWDNMLDSYDKGYTEAQANAVAYLMKACGYAAKSQYAEESTSTWESIMLKTFIDNFGYSDKGRFLVRDNYNTDTWENIIYQNLKNVGPVIYGGDQVYYGHCFICDGYSGNGFYHFNFGWSGYLDGYFQLTAINLYGTNSHGAIDGLAFNLNQDIVVNLTPAGNSTIELPDEMPLTWRGNLTAALTDSNTITLSHDNGEIYDNAISNFSPKYTDYEMCLSAYNSTNKTTTILDNTIYAFSQAIYGDDGDGFDNIKFAYGSKLGLAEGTYSLSPVARVAGTSEWKEVQHPVYATNVCLIKVDGEGNIVAVDGAGGEAPDIDGFKLESPLYMGKKFKYSFDVTSFSENDLVAAYIPEFYIYNSEIGSRVNIAEGEVTVTYLKPGDDLHLTFVSDMYVTEGYEDYTGFVYLELKSCVNGQTDYTLTTTADKVPTEKVELKADKFNVSRSEDNPENLTFDFTVTSNSGYYFDALYLYIEDKDENYVDIVSTDDEYCFVAGNTFAGSVNYNFTNYKAGEKYYAYLCYDDTESYCWFDVVDFTMPGSTSGIAELSDDNTVRIVANRAEGCIVVTAPSDIANVEGFALDGRAVNLNSTIAGASAKATLPSGIILVKVTLTDGTVSTAKVAR
jgi:hypothetical protein